MEIGCNNMTGNDDYKTHAYERALEHAHFVYQDLAATWRDIERKAQGGTAIAGIFLAAISLFYRSLECFSFCTSLLFFVSLLVLSSSALIAIYVLLVSEIRAPEKVKSVLRGVTDYVGEGGPGHPGATYQKFMEERIENWKEVNSSVHQKNMEKAGWLRCSQVILIFGVISFMVFGAFLFWECSGSDINCLC